MSKSKPEIIEAVGLTALRERGWTRKMVDTLIGEPDFIIQTPKDDKVKRTSFYRLARVEAAEQTEVLQGAAANLAKGTRRALAGADPNAVIGTPGRF